MAEAEGSKAVLGKAEVEERGDWGRRGAKLFFLFDEVGAANLGCERRGVSFRGG